MVKILLYQFEDSQVEDLAQLLTANDYEVLACPAEQNTASTPIKDADLILIDASGGLDGTGQCQRSVAAFPDTPLVLLAFRDCPPGPQCRLLTCNNVLLFPFSNKELLGRLDALLTGEQWGVLRVGELALDIKTRRVQRPGSTAHQLTPKQAQLLQVFMCYPERTLSRKFLMEAIWETDYIEDTRTLDVHVRWIRECIEQDPGKPRYLRTVRGVGYRFGVPPEDMTS
ncbi:MAG: response regulator transcription factor [Anaerolineae bacterium]|nr:response regulator transcription factor [Anaerolineae bacterium]